MQDIDLQQYITIKNQQQHSALSFLVDLFYNSFIELYKHKIIVFC